MATDRYGHDYHEEDRWSATADVTAVIDSIPSEYTDEMDAGEDVAAMAAIISDSDVFPEDMDFKPRDDGRYDFYARVAVLDCAGSDDAERRVRYAVNVYPFEDLEVEIVELDYRGTFVYDRWGLGRWNAPIAADTLR